MYYYVSRRSSGGAGICMSCKCRPEVAQQRGGECLSTTYKNGKGKLRWRCSSGHEWEASLANVKNGLRWCPHCAGNARSSIDIAQKVAEKRGGLCLSKIYRNARSKLRWRCADGHEWDACLDSIKGSGSWCPLCARAVLHHLKVAQQIAIGKGGECVSSVYVNMHTNLTWRCVAGHEWDAPLRRLKNSQSWCPQCAVASKRYLDLAKELASDRGGVCLSETCESLSTKLRWRCFAGHEWCASLRSVKVAGSWCRACHDISQRLGLSRAHEVAAKFGGECLSLKYLNTNAKLSWRCSAGHEWDAPLRVVRNAGRWCPYCSRDSAETRVRVILEDVYSKVWILDEFQRPQIRPESRRSRYRAGA